MIIFLFIFQFFADYPPNLISTWAGNLEYSKIELVGIMNTLMWIPWVIKSVVQNISYHFWNKEVVLNNKSWSIFTYSLSLFILALFFALLENIMVQYFLCHFLWYMNQYKGMKGDMIQYRCNNVHPAHIYYLTDTPVAALECTWALLL